MAKKDKKPEYVDDGHTVYDMDVEGFKWHDKGKKKRESLGMNFKEKFAMVRGAFIAYLPQILCILIGFGLTIGLIVLWLS